MMLSFLASAWGLSRPVRPSRVVVVCGGAGEFDVRADGELRRMGHRRTHRAAPHVTSAVHDAPPGGVVVTRTEGPRDAGIPSPAQVGPIPTGQAAASVTTRPAEP